MSLKLMYITNKPTVAEIAQKYGVDIIFIDLEQLGKNDRQANMNSVKSNHSVNDVPKIKKIVTTSQIMVRINPINPNSENEINEVINGGADIVMLPMWKTVEEVNQFIGFVDGRAKVFLLLETKEAAEIVSDIVKMDGIDAIHIGLNDLHLSFGKSFMFELLIDGTVDRLCDIIGKAGIPFGFGGIARIGEGLLPAEKIIAEHYRLGSQMAILSRSFCDSSIETDLSVIDEAFRIGLRKIHNLEDELVNKEKNYFISNHEEVKQITSSIAEKIKAAKTTAKGCNICRN